MSSAIIPSAYLAPIDYFQKLKDNDTILIEHCENFVKQTFRSRCEIYSPNGKQTLSIPLVKRNHKQLMKETKISYDYDWQRLHWRSLESAYRRSPFFEFYEDDFYPFYHNKKTEYLIDWNNEIQHLVLGLLKLNIQPRFTNEYKAVCDDDTIDLRNSFSPKSKNNNFETKLYFQVFESRHGFIPNLSIVDLLFNQGSRAMDYI